jgi:TPR repeat protein
MFGEIKCNIYFSILDKLKCCRKMNQKILTFIFTSFLLVLWVSPSIAVINDYQKAVDAYNRKDYKTSYELIFPLAEKGFAQAQYNLGVMYEKGKGVKKNSLKAKKWFLLAADQELKIAVEKINLLAKERSKRKQKDNSKALLERFSNLKTKNFEDGISAINNKDYKKAHQLFLQLAKEGDGKAQTNLGWMYEKGKGVPKDFQKAEKWYQLASEQGVAKAQEKLNLLLKGTVENKPQKAPKELIDSSFGFNANVFQDGLNAFNKEDYKTAYQLFLKLAEQGVSEAQYNLGLMYGKGMGVVKDQTQAIKWWELAAEQGNGKAQTNLGWMFERGKGVPKDFQKAEKWYQLASDQGVAKAQEKLNLLLSKPKDNFQEKVSSLSDSLLESNASSDSFRGDAFDGARYSEEKSISTNENISDSDLFHAAINSLSKNEYAKAHELFIDLAGKGVAEAQINLGMMFESGQGVPLDFTEAIRWYRLAADQGLTKAQEKLNLLLESKSPEKFQSSSMISDDFENKSPTNDAYNNAQDDFSTSEISDDFENKSPTNGAYNNAQGDFSTSDRFKDALSAFNQKKFDTAYKLFSELTDKGIAEAQINLGMMYEGGQGIPKDFKEAVRLYRLAADQGLTKAQYNLGLMYAHGKGIDKDSVEAIKWFQLAAEDNLIEAQTILGVMYEKGEGVTENHKEAIKWYQLAAEKGDADAQYKLGLMYSNGEGVLQDNKEAAKWFQLAVEKGNILAKGELDKLTREKSLWNRIKDIF